MSSRLHPDAWKSAAVAVSLCLVPAALAFPGHAGKGARTGWNEHDSDARVAVAGMDEREGTLAPGLPGSDLLARDAPLQSAQEALPTRVLAGLDRVLHA